MNEKNNLTKEQRTEIREQKREEKKTRLKLQLAKIAKVESAEARKKRARELIEIGAIISQFHDREKLLEYLKNPKYTVRKLDNSGVAVSDNKPLNGEMFTIFLQPEKRTLGAVYASTLPDRA